MKKETKAVLKKETDTEMLARLVVSGFEKMDKRFERVESDVSSIKKDVSSLKEDVSSLKEDVSSLKEDVSSLKEDVSSLKEGQKETNRRLASLERKQMGTLLSLDETVHRNEFERIVHRVEVLEKQ